MVRDFFRKYLKEKEECVEFVRSEVLKKKKG